MVVFPGCPFGENWFSLFKQIQICIPMMHGAEEILQLCGRVRFRDQCMSIIRPRQMAHKRMLGFICYLKAFDPYFDSLGTSCNVQALDRANVTARVTQHAQSLPSVFSSVQAVRRLQSVL